MFINKWLRAHWWGNHLLAFPLTNLLHKTLSVCQKFTFFAKWKSLSFCRIALQSLQSHSLSHWLHCVFFSFPRIVIAYKPADHFSKSMIKGKLRKNTNKRKHCVWDFPLAFNIRPDSIIWSKSSPFPVTDILNCQPISRIDFLLR